MIRKTVLGTLLVTGILLIGLYAFRLQQKINTLTNDRVEVLLVHGAEGNKTLGIRAFASVLEEEGVPYSVIPNGQLIATAPKKVAAHKPAIVYPDGSATMLSSDTADWVASYLQEGGAVLLSSDAGSKNSKGAYRNPGALFDVLAGVERATGETKSFAYGKMVFRSRQDADYFGIPLGKCDANNTITGYKYGALTYPYTVLHFVKEKKVHLFAFGRSNSDTNREVPLLAGKSVGKGMLLFVNLPLAALKGNSDDLLLRSTLRTFLFKMVKIPHLVSSPYAKGGIVLNLHIDSNAEHKSLPWFIAQGYVDPQLKYSFHITAGPDCYKIGDNAGFNAAGKGRKIVEALLPFGIVGSHGGWAHNWFSDGIENGTLDKEGIRKSIERNNHILESITGYPIREYSAPNGVFPQPESTEILASLGMKSYYYTGDSGSSPNRTFYQGRMLSENLIAFPVLPYGNKISLHEFAKENIRDENVAKMLKEVVDFTIRNRVVRLVYTHPYDIYLGPYKHAAKVFIDYCVLQQNSGNLKVETMSYFRDFLIRLIHTDKQIKWHDGVLEITLHAKQGLKAMVVAIPKTFQGRRVVVSESLQKDDTFYYVPIEGNRTEYHKVFRYE